MGDAEQQMVAEGGEGEGRGEGPRQRKKRLLSQIREQMEFYFSAANLSKDRFMGWLHRQSPFIPLETFFKFNRIRSLTEDVHLLRKAIEKSSILELDEDREQVRRSTAVEPKANEMECTIYVENIPPHADHTWVRQVFAQYGTIDYISLPRYACSGRPKGFAFVEFKTAEMASQALEAFGAMEAKISPTLGPAQLLNLQTRTFEEEVDQRTEGPALADHDIEGEVSQPQDVVSAPEKKGKKRKWSEEEVKENKVNNPDSETEPACTTDTGLEKRDRKRKQREEEGEEGRSKRRKEAVWDREEKAAEEPWEDTSSLGMEATDPSAPDKKKKKKRKRKRSQNERRDEVDSMYLKVMSKVDWKRLRSKYLSIQKQNMMLLKQQLWKRRHATTHPYTPTTYPYTPTTYSHQESQPPPPSQTSIVTPPQFMANAVVKISFEEPPQDPRKLRETIRDGGGGGVAFIDMSPSERDVFVRFLGADTAQSYLATGCWSRMELLKGEEEQQYWERVATCWAGRRGKKSRGASCPPEPRGRDKLLQKALREAQSSRSSQHIIFED